MAIEEIDRDRSVDKKLGGLLRDDEYKQISNLKLAGGPASACRHAT